MNQALELDMSNGFNPKQHTHFIWVLEEGIKKNFAKLKKHKQGFVNAKYEGNYAKDGTITTNMMNANNALNEALGRLNVYTELKTMIEHGWYCMNCGYLNDNEVTFDEKCMKCGNTL
jgi:hypothetical protein